MSEQTILRAILDYLKWKRVFCWRNNTGGFVDSKKHFYRFGDKGSPDIFAVRNGAIYRLEVKQAKTKQNLNQRIWQKDFERAGGIYHVVRSIEDAQAIFV